MDQYFISSATNTITSISTTDVAPSTAIFPTASSSTGSGVVTVSGEYIGVDPIDVVIEFVEGAGGVRATPPTVSSPALTATVTAGGSALPGGYVAACVSHVSEATRSYIDIAGVRLVAKDEGPLEIVITANNDGITNTDSENITVVDMRAGDTVIQGDFGATFANTDGTIPASAPRIRFGESSRDVYRHYRYRGESRIDPPLTMDIPRGTKVYYVTGAYSVNVGGDVFNNIVTLYDLMVAIRSGSTIVDVEGTIAPDYSPGGISVTEAIGLVGAYVLPLRSSGGRYLTGFPVTITDPNAKAGIIRAQCIDASEVMKEQWRVTTANDTLGSVYETGTTISVDGVEFTIPVQQPDRMLYPDPEGHVVVKSYSYKDRGELGFSELNMPRVRVSNTWVHNRCKSMELIFKFMGWSGSIYDNYMLFICTSADFYSITARGNPFEYYGIPNETGPDFALFKCDLEFISENNFVIGDIFTLEVRMMDRVYQQGDWYEIDVVSVPPLRLTGGTDAGGEELWDVTWPGGVERNVQRDSLVAGDVSIALTGAAVTGDVVSFFVESLPLVRYSINGGATWSPSFSIPDSGVIPLGSTGLTANLTLSSGSSVSFVAGDRYSFHVGQPNSPRNALNSSAASRYRPGRPYSINVASSGDPIVVIGSNGIRVLDGATTSISGADEYIVMIFSSAPVRLSVRAGEIEVVHQYKMARGNSLNPAARQRGKGVGAKISWRFNDSYLFQEDLEKLIRLVDESKAAFDAPVLFYAGDDAPVIVGRFGEDAISYCELSQFSHANHKLYEITLRLEPFYV